MEHKDYSRSEEIQNSPLPASDIVVTPGSKVCGVLYEVPDFLIERKTARAQKRKSLDEIEGEGINYKRETIRALTVQENSS